MATTETVASDLTSATDEQIVKKEKSKAIAEMIASLANEDEVKHDKPEDAVHADGDETKGELGVVKVEKTDDSPALEAFRTPATSFSKTEEDDKKVEPDVSAEKIDDPVSLEAYIADNLKEEKELLPDSHTTGDASKFQLEESLSTEPTVKETPQQLEKEPIETEEEKQPKIVDIPEASTETIGKSTNTAEANPQTESEAEVVKEAEILETSAQKEEKSEPEPEPVAVATEVQEKTREPEKEPQENPQKAEQPSTVTIPESSTEANAIEEKPKEPSLEILKETNGYEATSTESVKAEPVVTEVEENPTEPEKQPLEPKEEEQSNTVAISQVPSAETSEAIEEKTREPEVLKETENYEAGPTEAEKAEPVITKVDENPSEPEKQSFKQEEEVVPKTVIPETAGDTVEIHPPKELDIEVVKEIDDLELEAVPGKGEKPGDVVVVHPPIESDIEVVKETGTSELEAVPGKEEKPEPVSTEVEEKPRELLDVAEEVGKTSDVETKQEIVLETTKIEETSDDTIKVPISLKEEKTNKEEETSITANTEQVALNEESHAAPENLVEPSPEVVEKVVEEDVKKESKFNDVIEGVSKDEETSITANTAEVSLNEEAQAAQKNLVEPSPEVAEKIVEEDGKKESCFNDVIEQASIDQEAKTYLKEQRDYSVPTSVEEKVAVAANDDKKEPELPEAVQVSSREAEVEINKDQEQIEAKTATTEAGVLKVESVKDDGPAVDNEKGGLTDTKVDEISSAASEPVRETLASKFEEEATKTGVDNLEKEQTEEPVKTEVQVPDPPTKESDATKTSSKDLPKETPAKPAQKQSNNIISKVKQSLVKAKKAITGKSPSSKNPSSEAKDDIKVK